MLFEGVIGKDDFNNLFEGAWEGWRVVNCGYVDGFLGSCSFIVLVCLFSKLQTFMNEPSVVPIPDWNNSFVGVMGGGGGIVRNGMYPFVENFFYFFLQFLN